MKILLIYPYFIEDRIRDEDIRPVPIGVYSVAAVLRAQGYDVEILNWHDMRERPEEIRKTLAQKRPDAIGFSILHANRWGGLEIARIAKELNPEVKIVFGGVGATFLWKHLLTHFPHLDLVVMGEGEYPFLNIVRLIEKGRWGEIGEVEGIAFRKKGKIVRTQAPEPIRELDRLPIPAEYFAYQHVSSTRGCASKCRFCGSPTLWGGKIRFRSPGHFVDELELLYRRGISFFYVSDDTFTLKKDRVIAICKTILERRLPISWYAVSRVDCVDEEILYWMRKAGCIQISYGIESGSEKVRRFLNKHIAPDDIQRAFVLTRGYGILPRAYFIYGSPGETWETIQETIDLMVEIEPLGAIFYILDVFPGTGLYADLKKRRGIKDDIWMKRIESIMSFETDSRLSGDMILAFGEKLRAAFHEHLPGFARSIALVEERDLYPLHADFCSRLAMTFTHGDYAKIDAVEGKDRIAEELYERALRYWPDQRAYLGLGILKQKAGELEASIKILSEGLRQFPESQDLNLCLGISHMNLGRYESALSIFLRFPHSAQANHYAVLCRQQSRKNM